MVLSWGFPNYKPGVRLLFFGHSSGCLRGMIHSCPFFVRSQRQSNVHFPQGSFWGSTEGTEGIDEGFLQKHGAPDTTARGGLHTARMMAPHDCREGAPFPCPPQPAETPWLPAVRTELHTTSWKEARLSGEGPATRSPTSCAETSTASKPICGDVLLTGTAELLKMESVCCLSFCLCCTRDPREANQAEPCESCYSPRCFLVRFQALPDAFLRLSPDSQPIW